MADEELDIGDCVEVISEDTITGFGVPVPFGTKGEIVRIRDRNPITPGRQLHSLVTLRLSADPDRSVDVPADVLKRCG